MKPLVCNFKNFSILREGVSLFVKQSFGLKNGEIIEITGKNGIGKTSFLEFIAFKNLQYSGSYTISNVPFYLTIKIPIDSDNTVKENLEFWRSIYSNSTTEINNAITFWNLDRLLLTPIKYLSNGQKSRLNLLRMSLVKNKLLLLDEPQNFLDQHSMVLLKKFISIFIKQNGSIIVATNNLLNLGTQIALK